MGCVYLVKGFSKRTTGIDETNGSADGGRSNSLSRGWTVGLMTSLLNPKLGVFYIATIPQFQATGVSPLVMGMLLAAVHCVLGLAWCTLLIFGASAAGARLRSVSFVRWVDRVTGGALIAFGARLAFASRL